MRAKNSICTLLGLSLFLCMLLIAGCNKSTGISDSEDSTTKKLLLLYLVYPNRLS